jgi:aspartate/glutamate racemase
VILGGTELPLLLRAPVIAGLPVLDTTALHVEAIVARLTSP